MTSWQALHDELSLWRQPISFWWRDDDAIADSAALQKMLGIARKYQIAVHLAVIPSKLHPSLDVIKNESFSPYCYVLQHGFDHQSYALAEQRKIELGGSQDPDTLLKKLTAGRDILKEHFAQQYLDVLVPPWNRISDSVALALPSIGYKRLSVLGSSKRDETCFEYNVHIDIINWKERAFAGQEVILSKIIQHLRDKRLAVNTSDKPCGIMTHHLDHDLECWNFLTEFFSFCQQYDNIQWLSGSSIYPSSFA